DMSIDDMLGPIDNSWTPIGVHCLSCHHSCDPSPSNVLRSKDTELRALNTNYLPRCPCSMCHPLETVISEEAEIEETVQSSNSNGRYETKLNQLMDDVAKNGKTVLTSKYFSECLRTDD